MATAVLPWSLSGQTTDAVVLSLERRRFPWVDIVQEDADTLPLQDEDETTAAGDQVVGFELLRVLPVSGYELRRPMLVTIHRGPSYFWAAPDDFVLHGVGSTPEAAVEDYGYALVDYFEDLRERSESLASHLMAHLAYLDSIIGTDQP